MDLFGDKKPEPQYRCKHCGKIKGDHKALTFHCPLPSRRRSFVSFSQTRVYEADPKKPIKAPAFLIDQGYMG